MDLLSQPALPDTGVSHSDLQKGLNAVVDARLERILPALVVVYLAQSVAGFAFSSADSAKALGWLAYACGMVCSISWVCLRRDWVGSDRVHFVATLIGISILGSALAKSYLTSDLTQAAVVIASLLLVTAFTLLSWGYFVFLAVLGITSWITVASQKLPPSELIGWGIVLISAATIAAMAAKRRVDAHSRLLALSLARETQEREERVKQTNLQLAAQATNGALWYWDLKAGTFTYSPQWETLFGYEAGELQARVDAWFDRVHAGYLDKLKDHLAALRDGRSEQLENEHRLLRKDGTYAWVLTRGAAVCDKSGETVGLAGSLSDISLLIDVEKRLLDDSFHDKLTGLPNRQFFMIQLEKAIERKRGERRRAPGFAVMFLDLDRFKTVNDTLGHSVGDELLVQVATRLRACARPEDLVTRFGGDEFVLLLNRVGAAEEALAVGDRIQKALAAPFQIGAREVLSGASVGIALGSEGTDRSEDFLRFADMAMYQAKSKRDGNVRIFDADMNAQATRNSDLQNDLRRALNRRQFVLHYQPTVCLRSGKILGVEALIRWQRSPHELVAPADFIPLAEELGLINEIGEWALRSACTQSNAWRRSGVPHVRMAVNVSARQLQEKEFSKTVCRILDETGLPARSLELELTETALIESFDRAPSALTKLQDLGVGVAIDDFGTGYSSLSYLRKFDFQTLKIDRCFMEDIVLDQKAASLASGLITLAHNLKLSVIAEGVEFNHQRHFLEVHACDQLQGFLASKALPADQIEGLLKANDSLIELPVLSGDITRLASLHQVGHRAGGISTELTESALLRRALLEPFDITKN